MDLIYNNNSVRNFPRLFTWISSVWNINDYRSATSYRLIQLHIVFHQFHPRFAIHKTPHAKIHRIRRSFPCRASQVFLPLSMRKAFGIIETSQPKSSYRALLLEIGSARKHPKVPRCIRTRMFRYDDMTSCIPDCAHRVSRLSRRWMGTAKKW